MQKEYIPGIGRGIMLVLATVITAHANGGGREIRKNLLDLVSSISP
jgi:hypothetical protein